MENEFGTPSVKELAQGVPSPNGFFQSDVQTPPTTQQDIKTPSPTTCNVLMEQSQNNMVKEAVEEDQGKKGTHPDPVKVPLHQQKQQLWGFPGRYMSPTDRIMSPVSQTLLARNRRVLLPPSLAFSPPPKVLDGTSCKEFGPVAP